MADKMKEASHGIEKSAAGAASKNPEISKLADHQSSPDASHSDPQSATDKSSSKPDMSTENSNEKVLKKLPRRPTAYPSPSKNNATKEESLK